MSFDWQTEEDGGWDDLVTTSPDSGDKDPNEKRRWRRWLIPTALLLLALIAAGLVLNRRAMVVTEQIEADVLTSHELVQEAIAEQDDEVFRSLLSGRDDEWADEMTSALMEGTLMERWGLGFHSLPVTEPVSPTIEVSADLLEAEVITVVPYAIQIGNGLTETVELAQTAVYRQGTNRWLLSPPDVAYWGGTRQIEGRYVTLFYPERDQELAHDLLLNLDEKIGQLCAQIQDIACPEPYNFIVELDTDPAVFENLFLSSTIAAAQSRHLLLPAPTLVGLPVDRAGENALFRGYGKLVVGALLTDLLEYDCCGSDLPIFIEVLNVYFQRLGLQPKIEMGETAVSAEEFDALLKAGPPKLFEDQSLWLERAEEYETLSTSRPAALVAFAQEELGLEGRDLMQSLEMLRDDQPYGDWLRMVSHTGLSTSEMESAWLSFVYRNSSIAQLEPPTDLPDQDINLLCYMGDEERVAFYRYHLADDVTQLERPLNREVIVMAALPEDDGLAVWEAGFGDKLTSIFLLVNDMKTTISWDAGEDSSGPVPMNADPSNSKLVLAPALEGETNYGLLDVPGCLGDNCRLDTLPGYPVWSPALSHMILLKSDNNRAHMAQARGQLMLADRMGEVITVLGEGYAPFWLDDKTFGFVVDADEGRRNAIVTGTIDQPDTEILLTTEDLTSVRFDVEPLRMIDYVAVQSSDPNRLVIVTIDAESDEETFDWFKENQPGATLFFYNLENRELEYFNSFAYNVGFLRSYRLSPDGRFLLLGEGAEYRPTNVYILDTETGETVQLLLQSKFLDSIYWYTDFSLDGKWLLVMDDGFIHLLYPGTGYNRFVIPTTGQCESAVWINRND
jgi:hypothetical protein